MTDTNQAGGKFVGIYLPPKLIEMLDREWKLRLYKSRTDMIRQVIAREIGYEPLA